MKVELKRLDDAFHFEAKNEIGRTVEMDAGPSLGGKNQGVSPMQMLLMSLAGCSAIDIVLILKKQKQIIDDFQITVDGDRENVKDGAAVFKKIHVVYHFHGSADPSKIERAISLSMDKYCSVSKTLEKTAQITWSFTLNGEEVKSQKEI